MSLAVFVIHFVSGETQKTAAHNLVDACERLGINGDLLYELDFFTKGGEKHRINGAGCGCNCDSKMFSGKTCDHDLIAVGLRTPDVNRMLMQLVGSRR